eukprot:CAMPEP_0183736828 /NCGR_PEP_ID=MMETSP0737-20130205/50367_1 /TAXON_ID=385413 /ORGANISM="Thalassiosira miniscula, Strain CCMP1093" /LENGTH=211 /DNA_ID=CAMNT_0025970943 /DNA_START=480 /DNA_END=1111 /DNA_ORIENTATION=-
MGHSAIYSYNHDRNRYARRGRINNAHKHSSLGFRLMSSKDGQVSETENATSSSIDTNIDVKSSPEELESPEPQNSNVTVTTPNEDETSPQTSLSVSAKANKNQQPQKQKWQANNFEKDYQLLKTAMAKQSATTNLQQLQRKHLLDYGFARNRRPLVRDLLRTIAIIGGWMMLLLGGGAGGGHGATNDAIVRAWNMSQSSWRRKWHILAANA